MDLRDREKSLSFYSLVDMGQGEEFGSFDMWGV